MRIDQYGVKLDVESQIAYLVKEHGFNYGLDTKANCPESVYDLMVNHYHLNEEANEKIYLLCMNTKLKLIGSFLVSSGTINASILSPREILLRALLCNAANIIIVHNHPSGDTTPSSDDMYSTKRLNEACKTVGVKLNDHIIIGQSYYSFKETGQIN